MNRSQEKHAAWRTVRDRRNRMRAANDLDEVLGIKYYEPITIEYTDIHFVAPGMMKMTYHGSEYYYNVVTGERTGPYRSDL